MDRTEEIKELMIRLVTLLAEEQSQMRSEMTELRKAVERMSASGCGHEPAAVPEEEPQASPEPERTKVPEQAMEPESEPELKSESDSLFIPASVPFRFKDLPDDDQEFEAAPVTAETEPSHEAESDSVSQSAEEPEPESDSDACPESAPEPEDDPEINPGADFDPDAEPEFVVEPIKTIETPREGVLRPRSREEQISDTSEWGMFFNPGISSGSTQEISRTPVLGELFSREEAEPDADPSWMTDIPGPEVNSVYEALTNNDRFQFIRDLFDDDDEQFALSMDRIDRCSTFGQVVSEMRVAFPEWDERSPLVYQFYMMVRRRFR